MITLILYCLRPQARNGWDDIKDRKSQRERLGRFCDINCAVILQYSFALHIISDILWSRVKFFKSTFLLKCPVRLIQQSFGTKCSEGQ